MNIFTNQEIKTINESIQQQMDISECLIDDLLSNSDEHIDRVELTKVTRKYFEYKGLLSKTRSERKVDGGVQYTYAANSALYINDLVVGALTIMLEMYDGQGLTIQLYNIVSALAKVQYAQARAL